MNRFAPAVFTKESKDIESFIPETHSHDSSSLKETTFHSCGLHFGSLACVEAVWFWRTWLHYNMTYWPNQWQQINGCWAMLGSFAPWGHGAQSSIFWWGSLHASWDPYGSREFRFLKFVISNQPVLPVLGFSLYPCLKLFRAPKSWLNVISILRRASRRCWRWSPWIIWSGMSLWRISPVQVRDLACFNGNLTASVCHFF